MQGISVTISNGSRTVPLDGSVFGFAEWPGFLDGLGLGTSWDEAAGVYRGEQPIGVKGVEMKLVARGRDVTRAVSELLDMLCGSEGDCVVTVWSRHGGYRQKRLRFLEVGGVAWHPAPYSAVLAEVPLRFETSGAAWSGRKIHHTAMTGDIKVPYQGDVPAWPVIRIPATSVGMRVTLGDEAPQALPPSSTGWVIHTEPSRRGVIDGNGTPIVGMVPFWPDPPALNGGSMRLSVTANNGAKIGGIVVEATEMWRKAWA